jgi:hypothetical protein
MTLEYAVEPNFREPGNIQHNVWGLDLASAATIAPTHPFHRVSGTAEIATITVPYDGFAGVIFLVATGAWTTATTGNIAKAITAVASAVVPLVYNPIAAKWYPIVP